VHDVIKVSALTITASLLAACSGGASGVNGTLPNTGSPSATGQDRLRMTSIFTAVGENGATIHVFPTREVVSRYRALQRAIPFGKPTHGSANLTYRGGPVETAPKIYVVFWGSAWTGSGDPDGVATILKNWYSTMGGSKWLNSTTQYTQSNGAHVGNPTGQFAGSYVDGSSSPPSSPTQTALAAEAATAAAHFGVSGPNASIVVALPTGISPSGFKTQYCAYHSTTSGNGGTISWTNLPYLPDAGTSCGAGSVNSPGTTDGVTIVSGHEQGETATDPQPNTGWLDGSGQENGDKCAWTNLLNNPAAGGYPTQPLWSNATSSCVQSY